MPDKHEEKHKTPEGGDPEKKTDRISGWFWLAVFLAGSAAFVWCVWKLRR
jgi:hypothetical protein